MLAARWIEIASESCVNENSGPARTGIAGLSLVGVEPGCRLLSSEALAAICALVDVSRTVWPGD